MFKFLKKKIQETVKKFSKTVEEESVELDQTELTSEEKQLLEQEDQHVQDDFVESVQDDSGVGSDDLVEVESVQDDSGDEVETDVDDKSEVVLNNSDGFILEKSDLEPKLEQTAKLEPIIQEKLDSESVVVIDENNTVNRTEDKSLFEPKDNVDEILNEDNSKSTKVSSVKNSTPDSLVEQPIEDIVKDQSVDVKPINNIVEEDSEDNSVEDNSVEDNPVEDNPVGDNPVEDNPVDGVKDVLKDDSENKFDTPLVDNADSKNEFVQDDSENKLEEDELENTISEKDISGDAFTVDVPKDTVQDEFVASDLSSEKIDEDIAEELDELEGHKKKKSFMSRLFGKKKHTINEIKEVVKESSNTSQEANKLDEAVDAANDVDDVLDAVSTPKDALVGADIDDVSVQEGSVVKSISDSKDKSISKNVSNSIKVKSSKSIAREDLLVEDVKDATKKKKGFFSKIKEKVVKFKLTDDAFEEMFWDFELALLENNVAIEVIEKIKRDLQEKLTAENVSRRSVEEIMLTSLKDSLEDVLDVKPIDLLSRIRTRTRQSDDSRANSAKMPFVICVVGVNGSGKTTTLAKLIKYFQKNNLSLVVAAADTFRAAAIQQLEEHTTKLGVKLIKHDYNADPSAVAYDAIKHAVAKNLDVVLIDTAGRLQSNSNLMDELRKLVRVNKPDFNLFIGESITGNDCVEQAVAFNDAVGIDGIVLSKADVDDKGGAAISVSYVTKKPILFLGVGQNYDDLKVYDKKLILDALGL